MPATHSKAIFEKFIPRIGVMPARDLLRDLFTAFRRGRNVGSIPGTGLGVVVVKHWVHLHGGSVSFVNVPNKETRFTLRIPCFTPPPTQAHHAQSPALPSPLPSAKTP